MDKTKRPASESELEGIVRAAYGMAVKGDYAAALDTNGNMYFGPRQGTGLPQYMYMSTMGLGTWNI